MNLLRSVIGIGLMMIVPATLQAAVIGFEGLPDGTVISNQFPGLVFANAIVVRTAGISLNEFEFPPHSGGNVVSDDGGPISINFPAPVQSFGGYFTHRHAVTVQAFDANNNPVAMASSAFANNLACMAGPPCLGAAGSSPNTLLQVTSSTGIARVTITGDSAGSSFTLDDITITPASSTNPTVTTVSPAGGIRGNSVNVTLTGTNFVSGLTVNAGSGIGVTDINVDSASSATATLTIAANTPLGARNVTVTTPGGTSGAATFVVIDADAFPDLTLTSTHARNFAVGFNELYIVTVTNVGAVESGTYAVTDVLPTGLTFVSGTGLDWSCSVAEPTVTCTNSSGLAAGATSTLTITVAVSVAAAPNVTHAVSVTTAADLNPANNTASDPTTVVATPSPSFAFTPVPLRPAQSAALTVTIASPFPRDVTGSVTLSFTSNAAIPLDDPEIQFAAGGRQIPFTIPANTLEAHFGTSESAGPAGFQTGTVAGVLAFNGVLQAGSVQTAFSPTLDVGSLTIPLQAPSIHAVAMIVQPTQTTTGQTVNNITVQTTLWSTMREVTEVNLQFNTSPAVQLSCGSVSGCTASGSAVTINIKALFDAWFSSDVSFGSLSVLSLPMSVPTTIHGMVVITLRNSQGASNAMSFILP